MAPMAADVWCPPWCRDGALMLERLRTVALLGDTQIAEAIIGLVSLLVGAWLGWPRPPVEVLSPPYSVLIRSGWPVYAWGFVFLALGTARMVALAAGHTPTRKLLSFVSIPLWAFVAHAFWASDPRAPSVPVFGFFAFLAGWIRVRFYIDEALYRIPNRPVTWQEWLRIFGSRRGA